jgi:hypothetical protein
MLAMRANQLLFNPIYIIKKQQRENSATQRYDRRNDNRSSNRSCSGRIRK